MANLDEKNVLSCFTSESVVATPGVATTDSDAKVGFTRAFLASFHKPTIRSSMHFEMD